MWSSVQNWHLLPMNRGFINAEEKVSKRISQIVFLRRFYVLHKESYTLKSIEQVSSN